MEFNDIKVGMKCGSNKGSGTVTWLDGATNTIYMENNNNAKQFAVNIEDIIDDPQIHNNQDTYY